MTWQLIVNDGPDRGTKAEFNNGELLIGRDPESCDLALSDSDVSRNHARIIINSDKTTQIEDLNSTNGTYVNQQRLFGPVQLHPADEIFIGANRLQLNWNEGKTIAQTQGHAASGLYSDQALASPSLSMSEALTAPFSREGWPKWLLGSIFAAIPLISFFADGYRYRLIKSGLEGNIKMPEWNNWGDLFIKGLLFFLIRLLYLLLPAVSGLLILRHFINSPDASVSFIMGGFVFVLFFSLIIGFFIPMSWAYFASTGYFADAFKFNAIIESIRSVFPKYLTILLIYIALYAAISLLALVPLAGPLLAIFGMFYTYIVTGLLFGEVFRLSRSLANK